MWEVDAGRLILDQQINMEKRKLGKNRGIWSGIVVSALEFSHDLKNKDDNSIIERFYKFKVEVEVINKKQKTKEVSTLPVMISESKLNELDEKVTVGRIVFLKGSWRTYDNSDSPNAKTRLEQNIFVKSIEVHSEYTVRTRNKFEFEGFLVKKLFEIQRDEDGKQLKDEQGRLVPKRDEDGNLKYTVRRNKEDEVVNDMIIAINRPNGSDYIPSVAYEKMASKIATRIPVGAEIQGVGYIRSREYVFNGETRIAYEAIITELELKEPEIKQDEQEGTERENTETLGQE